LRHPVAGADRHSGLVDDDLEVGHVLGDRLRDGQHVLQVGRAVLVGRGADGDELDPAEIDAGLGVGGEQQPPGLAVAPHHFGETGFVDRHAAVIEQVDLGGVDVHAHDLVADLGQTGAGHQADVAASKNRDFHVLLLVLGCISKAGPRLAVPERLS